MKILVTGSNGMLGQKLVHKLMGSGHVVHAVSSGKNRMIEESGYEYHSLDITHKESVMQLMAFLRPDCVINSAAMTNVDACETDRETCWTVNVEGVKNIVSALEAISSDTFRPHFIQISTDFVFDGEKGPYSEDDDPNPLSFYALSKLESEHVVQASNLPWTVIRTIIVYGVCDNMVRSNLVLWAKKSLENNQSIKVIKDQFRAPTLAEDLADACISAAVRKAEGIFHVSGPETKPILELVYDVADFFGLDKDHIIPVTSQELNQPAKRPPVTGFKIDKAQKILDYKPHTFEQGLALIKQQLMNIKSNL